MHMIMKYLQFVWNFFNWIEAGNLYYSETESPLSKLLASCPALSFYCTLRFFCLATVVFPDTHFMFSYTFSSRAWRQILILSNAHGAQDYPCTAHLAGQFVLTIHPGLAPSGRPALGLPRFWLRFFPRGCSQQWFYVWAIAIQFCLSW